MTCRQYDPGSMKTMEKPLSTASQEPRPRPPTHPLALLPPVGYFMREKASFIPFSPFPNHSLMLATVRHELTTRGKT